MKKFVKICVFAVLAMGAASTARASVVIDFSSGGAFGGTITTDGTNWFGTGIPMTTLKVAGAPTNNGTYTATGFADDIENPVITSDDRPDCCASLNFDSKAKTISIVGAVPSLGIGNQTLLSGTITNFTQTGAFGFEAFSASGPDSKSAELLRVLGLPTDKSFAFFDFTIALANATGGGFYSTSTDITNVPEPGTLALFGVGLLGVARKLRRVVA